MVSHFYTVAPLISATRQVYVQMEIAGSNMKPAGIWDWLGPLAIITIFIAYLFATAPNEFSLCTGENCFREWFSALSGWVALGAAIVTLLVMREQVEVQRQQTDYIIGNMPPEITVEAINRVEEQEWYPTVRITVTNRNRRPIRIGSVNFLGDERIKIGVYRVGVGNDVENKIFAKRICHTNVHRVLPGKDEGVAAPRCVVDCHVFWDGKMTSLINEVDKWLEYQGKVTVAAYIIAEREQLVTLEQYVSISL